MYTMVWESWRINHAGFRSRTERVSRTDRPVRPVDRDPTRNSAWSPVNNASGGKVSSTLAGRHAPAKRPRELEDCRAVRKERERVQREETDRRRDEWQVARRTRSFSGHVPGAKQLVGCVERTTMHPLVFLVLRLVHANWKHVARMRPPKWKTYSVLFDISPSFPLDSLRSRWLAILLDLSTKNSNVNEHTG